MKKIMLAFGTRPEAIKMLPIYLYLVTNYSDVKVSVCVTGQHKELLDQVLQLFNVTPEFNLKVMKKNQNLFEITSEILLGMKNVFEKDKPDILLVHGDTTTSLSSSIAAFYYNIPVAHIEAGLRTYDLKAPFPEELNRQLVSRIANWHFTPTTLSKNNLLKELIDKRKIFVTGNTVIDALKMVIKMIDTDNVLRDQIEVKLNKELNFSYRENKFILITGHRRESFGQGLKNICEAIKCVAQSHSDVHFIYPIHLNPQILKPVKSILKKIDNIHLLEPLSYEVFIYLLKNCYFAITDSGGVQEEAPSIGKPVLITRELTERSEVLKEGTSIIVGTSKNAIVSNINKLLKDRNLYKKMSKVSNHYGDGFASKRICDVIGKN